MYYLALQIAQQIHSESNKPFQTDLLLTKTVCYSRGGVCNCGGAYTSVLQDAAAKADVAVVEYLLKRGATVNSGTKWNRTPLLEATNRHNTLVVALLLRHGAKTKERCEKAGLGFQTGETALHLANRKRCFDIVGLLKGAGARN